MSKIHSALLGIQSEIGHIAKTQRVMNFKGRGIDQVYAKLHPLAIKYGVIMSTEVLAREYERSGKQVWVRAHFKFGFHAEDGSSVYTEGIGEGLDSSDKASGKAASYAHKYAILQMFSVPVEGIPDAEDTAETHNGPAVYSNGNVQHKRRLADLLKSKGVEMNAENKAWAGEFSKGLEGVPLDEIEQRINQALEKA